MLLRSIQILKSVLSIFAASLALLSCWNSDPPNNSPSGSTNTGCAGASASPDIQRAVAAAVNNGAIASGQFHSIALKSDGTVWTWGDNFFGQLGNGATADECVPVVVGGLTDVVMIAAGYNHSLALKSDRTVWAWGSNFSGQLGIGTADGEAHAAPVQVLGPAGAGFLTGIVSISAGEGYSLSLKDDGTVWSWGDNTYGQLGDGTTAGHTVPVEVIDSAACLQGVAAVAAGGRHSLVLKTDESLCAWGQNSGGQLGNGGLTDSPLPAPISVLGGVTAVSAGDGHSVALKSDGTVWTWGSNGEGQLGNGTLNPATLPTAVATDMTAVSAGYGHTLALKTDLTVWAWGDNFFGQLGNSAFDDSSVPFQVSGLTGPIAVSGGGSHSLAVRSNGTVWAWGENQSGQLGDGTDGATVVSRTTPVQVIDLILF